jgi:copper/silver efflux system protein
MYRSENARPSGWVYVDVRGRDVSSVARDLAAAIRDRVTLTPGMSASITGQFEYLERAAARLKLVIPATLGIIFVLLYLTFRRVDAALLVMSTLPFALIGGVWLMYLAGFELSVASAVGFIALAGVAAEFGVVMVLYLDRAVADAGAGGGKLDNTGFDSAIRHGAVQRVRPKAMTVAVILGGLLPILFGSGTGSEIMSRIAAPMVGGMLTAPLMSMLLVPVVYRVMRRSAQIDSHDANRSRREGVDI